MIFASLACVLILLGAGAAVAGQGAAPAKKEPPKLPEALAELAARARAVPPEFAADVLIRIAGSGRVPTPELKRQLLEDAFELAANAKEPVRRRDIGLLAGNTRAGFQSSAFDFGFDALTLQGRAVQAMIPVDKRRARELFQRIPLPQLQPTTCRDVLVYQVDDFYETLQAVVESTFTAQERQRDEHIHLMERYLAAVHSPAQIPGAVQAVLGLRKSRPQFELLIQTLTTALENVQPGDRPPTGFDPFWIFHQLVQQARSQGIPSGGAVKALREYLLRELNANYCADGRETYPFLLKQSLKQMNELFEAGRASGESALQPISADEVKPKFEGEAAAVPFWRTVFSKQLHQRFLKLRDRLQAERGVPWPEWEAEFNEFQAQLESWTGSEENSEADFFHEKCSLMEGVVAMLPKGEARQTAMRNLVAFLAASDMRLNSPMEWFLHANPVIQKVLSSNADERAEGLAAMQSSRDPVLWLYADLERELRQK